MEAIEFDQQNSLRYKELKEAVEAEITFINSDDFCEDVLGDHTHTIYEAAMEFILGTGLWDEYNRLVDEANERVE